MENRFRSNANIKGYYACVSLMGALAVSYMITHGQEAKSLLLLTKKLNSMRNIFYVKVKVYKNKGHFVPNSMAFAL